MKKTKKAFMELSFGWLFALVVGAFILFLAIFLSVKIIKNEGTKQGAEVSKDIGIILDPLETGFEESKSTNLQLGIKSKIENTCDSEGDFGRNIIKTSQEVFGKSEGGDIEVSFRNKYIFSEGVISGKEFYIFTKKFEFPFKVADVIFIIPKEKTYCFVNAPKNISTNIRDLGLDNIVNVTNIGNCPENSETVCFSSVGACDTKVNLGQKKTTKNKETMSFETEALMYGSIFSSKETYECQMKRLMKRVSSLAKLYNAKKNFIALKNCNTNVDLISLEILSNAYTDSSGLFALNNIQEDIARINSNSLCELW